MAKKGRKPKKTSDGRGGLRNPPGGRPLTAVGKLKREAQAQINDGGLKPSEYFLRVLRNEDEPQERRDAAATLLLPYEMPKLSTTEHVIVSPFASMSQPERDSAFVAGTLEAMRELIVRNPQLAAQALDRLEALRGVHYINGECRQLPVEQLANDEGVPA